MNLILASASPRRKELLERAGIEFETAPSFFDESAAPQGLSPRELVLFLSLEKARKARSRLDAEARERAVILGADTVVDIDGQILGKPKDEADAYRMLSLLRGHTHTVYTGVAILADDNEIRFCETTEVTMRALSDEEVWAYIKSGEPMGKAGSYGIQGKAGLFVTGINGDYNNIVGLPLTKVYVELQKIRAAK